MNDTVTDLRQYNNHVFDGIVGQEHPKREISFYLDSYIDTHMVPHMGIIAPRGQGKTKTARAIAKGLYQFDDEGKPMFRPSTANPAVLVPKRKPFLEINCSTIKNVKAFSSVLHEIQDKDITLFFDEASEIPHDVSMALLTILEPNSTNRTQFTHDEYTYDFDFRRQSFIFATTESQKVFHALMDRLERITLQEYSSKDLADIVKINLLDVAIDDALSLEISSVLRGNARAAQKMSEKIRAYLKGRKIFTHPDWESLKSILSIHPLGLNAIEIQVLRFLESNPHGTSLTAMSAKTGMSRDQLRQDSELYLLKYNLMEITTTGRNITSAGLDYLRRLG